MKTYNLIELLTEIKAGKIKERTKIEMINKEDTWKEELIYLNGDLITECGDDIFETYTLLTLLHSEFTLIEETEEIDIQGIENLYINCLFTDVDKDGNEYKIVEKIDELIQVAKQLDRKIGGINENRNKI